ncbi:MAG TPA: L-seryl-tRNA(Sec) selenium transferase [Gemmatimonadaceae bacterium]|nr:L-seryl-tRNA(Sec) selenium transferase [Gemmatimonadaceae bacterium]
MSDPRRSLPSVDTLLRATPARALLERAPRTLVVDAVRDALESIRREPGRAPDSDAGWGALIEAALAERERRSLRPVFNATGVVLHTNLGRAPLPAAALAAIGEVATGYSNLEYDLDRGTRGSRHTHCAALLREITGAEDAMVVNNGAAALLLAVNTLALGREVIVSRGELVEIGGSFRIPDVMARGGAALVEVGTTNRTHLRDYVGALSPATGAVVKVHRSNFTMQGFVTEVSVEALASELGAEGPPIINDLGSGLFVSLDELGLRGEPLVSNAVRSGAAVITMSGDKLLGGPQAGIALGRRSVIDGMRRNPLTRALRVDKLTLAALEATLALYRDPATAMREIPALAMLTAPEARIRERASTLCSRLAAAGHRAAAVSSSASVGGGSFPTTRIPSAAVALEGDAETIESRLRGAARPVIGRIEEGRVLLDLRSVPESDDDALTIAVLAALS